MTRLVVDSWAWVEYLDGSKVGEKVKQRFLEEDELWTSVVSLAELNSKYHRKRMSGNIALEAIGSLSKLGVPDRDDAVEAGTLHARARDRSADFGLADAFALQLARKVKGKVLTGDPHFKGFKEAEFVG